MSYYRPSFSQTVAMTRGRGYSSSRGGSSYRGSSSRGGGSSWGGGRGFSSSRGGGGGFSSSSSSFGGYDSRSKYSGSSDRYSSSRGHSDDYRKSYRSDGYSGRDDGHRSPDRKRMRTEAPSSRHDSSGGYSDSYSGRYESSSGYPPRRSFSEDHRRGGGGGSFSRRGDDFRKPSGPPTSTPRGGYRGRISSRGSRGLRGRDRPLRRRMVDSSYAIHKRVVSSRSADYARRLKMTRLRSAAFRRSTGKIKSEKRDSDDDKNDDDDEEEEEDWDKEVALKEEKKQNGDGEDSKDAEKKEETPTKKEIKKEIMSDKEDKKSDSENGDKSPYKKKHIDLLCIHCGRKCFTFAKYKIHLSSGKHISAMRRVAVRQKAILGQMRLAQRNAQRELEKTTDDLAPRTNFCPLCKLNYKQPKLTHQNSESHKNMKKFLMPYCRVCKMTFKSPMLYENHLCSLEHIKRKSRLEGMSKSDKEDSPTEDDNLENFMTIDSVGDVDDEDTTKKEAKESDSKKEEINVGIEQIRKVEVHYCDLCRMYLPRVEESEVPRILAKHCKMRIHMQQYVRYKEDRDLAKHAERLQRKENAEKERGEKKEKEDAKTELSSKQEKSAKPSDEKGKVSADDDDGGDDKLWADVDKDLGDILAEAESGNKSSDEDEDSHAGGERYDRFKTAADEKVKAAEGDAAEKKEDAASEEKVTEK